MIAKDFSLEANSTHHTLPPPNDNKITYILQCSLTLSMGGVCIFGGWFKHPKTGLLESGAR